MDRDLSRRQREALTSDRDRLNERASSRKRRPNDDESGLMIPIATSHLRRGITTFLPRALLEHF
jgi:hypothetical protein